MSATLDQDFPLPIKGPFVKPETMNAFNELSVVDCSAHVEKKGRFTYLSWPFAFAELFKRYPKAQIEIREWDGFPAVKGPKGWMVCVSVTIDGVTRTQWHPVLDNNNKPIPEPDVFQLNTSIQRGTVKAIALHGLGLYIYAGEDLPEGVEPEPKPEAKPNAMQESAKSIARAEFDGMPPEVRARLQEVAKAVSDLLMVSDVPGAVEIIEHENMDADNKTALWSLFDSKQRSAIKAYWATRKTAA